MARLRRSIPSLGALAAFEAAARLGGFTKAANELGVTQAAVSRQIRSLEIDLNVQLFRRTPRQVELTPAGKVLAAAVSDAFETMSDAIDHLRQPGDPHSLTICATMSFSHFWLLPRLPSFRSMHPALNIRVLSRDDLGDLGQDDIDVLIRWGVGPFSDGQELVHLSDEVFPVCSLEFAETYGCFAAEPETLSRLPLIEASGDRSQWMSWPQWFAMVGLTRVPQPRTLVFNHYSDGVYAAISGQGVVLGWKQLIERPLKDGRLVRIGNETVAPPERHCLVVPRREPIKPATRAFADWMEAALSENA